MSEEQKPHIERLRAHAEQAIAYEEAGAAKHGRVPDETYDEWQRGKDILSLIEQLEALRNFNAATRAAYETLNASGISSALPEAGGAGPGPLGSTPIPATSDGAAFDRYASEQIPQFAARIQELEEQLEAARRWHTEVCACGDFEDHLASYPAKEPDE